MPKTTEVVEEEQFTEIDKAFDDGPKRRGRPRGSSNKSIPVKSEEEVRTGLSTLFELLAMAFNSTASFDEAEFGPMARSLIRLAEIHPQLKVILVMIAPLAVMGQAIKFVRRILDNRQPKKPKQQQEGQHEVDPYGAMNNSSGMTEPISLVQ